MEFNARELRMYEALKRIASYDSVERIKRDAGKRYGLLNDEAVEMAYENVIAEATAATRGMHGPKAKKP
jgi:transcription-repair coupling factor (superfamily II helicase)